MLIRIAIISNAPTEILMFRVPMGHVYLLLGKSTTTGQVMSTTQNYNNTVGTLFGCIFFTIL